jgi:hypothetical protein
MKEEARGWEKELRLSSGPICLSLFHPTALSSPKIPKKIDARGHAYEPSPLSHIAFLILYFTKERGEEKKML